MTGQHVDIQQSQHRSSFMAHQRNDDAKRSRPSGMSVSDLLSSGSRRDTPTATASSLHNNDQTARSSFSDGRSNDNDMHSPPTDDGHSSSRMSLSRTSSSAALARADAVMRRAQTPSGSEQQVVEGGTAYQYAAVQQITEGRENIEYILTIREQPKHSRMCGVGEKADRRPIDPAPIIQLRVVTHDHPNPVSTSAGGQKNIQSDDAERAASEPARMMPLGDSRSSSIINALPPDQQHVSLDRRWNNVRRGVPVRTEWGDGWEDKTWYLENPYYFMYAMLADAETDEELHLLGDGKTRYTTGSCVSCLYHLKDIDGSEQGFFVFPDLSIRIEGRYRLKLCLFETIGHEVHHCKSVYSKPFNVYTAKRFPGMEESTLLSKSFADQGLKVRVRKNPRARRARGTAGKRKDAMDSDDDSDGGAYRDPSSMMPSSAMVAATNKRIKGVMQLSDESTYRGDGGNSMARQRGDGGDFAYDAYAEPPGPSQHASNHYAGPPPVRTAVPAQSYSPEERREGPSVDFYNEKAQYMRSHVRPPPPTTTQMEEGSRSMQMQPHLRHGPPPPPGYIDAAEMDARRGLADHRPGGARFQSGGDEQRRYQHQHHGPPPHMGGGHMMHPDQHAAIAAERDAFNRERDAALFEEQQQMLRERHRRSTLPVGPPPPAPSLHVDASQGRGEDAGMNPYDPRYGPTPRTASSSLAVAAASRDRSISDPYQTHGGHRTTMANGGDNRADSGIYAAEHPDTRRHRLPPLHVALSPDQRVPSGMPISRPRSAQQPHATLKGAYSSPEHVQQQQQQHAPPPSADRRHHQQQGHFYGGPGSGYLPPAEQLSGAPMMYDEAASMRHTSSFPPPPPQHYTHGQSSGGSGNGGGMTHMPPPPHSIKVVDSAAATMSGGGGQRAQPPSAYHGGGRPTHYGGGGSGH